MKKLLTATLPLLVLANPALGCTDAIFRLLSSNISLGLVTVGTPVQITIDATTTGYDGSNGDGPLRITPVSGDTSALTIGAVSFTPNPPLWGRSQPFKITMTVTVLRAGVTTILFNTACGSFAGNPVSAPATSDGGPVTAPPTTGGLFLPPTIGEPINAANGELFGHDETADIALGGPIPVVFRRYYGSYLQGKVTSALGPNWMHTFDISLAIRNSTATATLFRGKTVAFTQTNGAWRLSSNEQRNWQLIASGTTYQLLDARANLIYTFNTSGALTSIQDRNGNTVTVTPGTNGPTQISDGTGRTLTLTYTGTNLTRVADQAGRAVTFEYTASNLSAFVDLNGKRTTFAYTTGGGLSGLMTTSTRPAGNQPFSQTYDSQGRVATQTDSFSNRLSLAYGSASAGTTTTDAAGTTLTFVADANSNLSAMSDPSGGVSRFAYDANQRPTSITDRLGNRTTQAWDSASAMLSGITDALGNATSLNWASSAAGGLTFQDLTGLRYADGASVTFTRDSKGNVTSVTDPAGNVTRATYTAAGLPAAITNPAGGVYTYAYNANNTLASVRTPSGDTTRFTYDNALRVTQITYADGTSRTIAYDTLGNVTRVTNERNNSVASAWDNNNNLRTLTDALGAVRTFARDTDDRLSSVTDALSRATTRTFDAQSRLRSVTNAAGNTITNSYDNLSRLTSRADASGATVSYTRDAEGRVTGITDPLQRTTRYSRNAVGLITRTTTAKGEVFDRTYDNRNRPLTVTDPLNRTASVTYDVRGLQTATQLPGGVSASFNYNALGKLTSVTDPMGNAWQRDYDNMGRITSITDPLSRKSSFSYDSRQRVSQVTFPAGSLQNTWDGAGNNTARRYSDGTNLTFTWDANNRMTAASGLTLSYDANGRIANSNGLGITRDAAGRIATVVYGANKTVTYTWNNRGLLASVADWVGGTTSFTWDAAAQLTSVAFANGNTQAFTYDANGRMLTTAVTRASTSLGSLTLVRDAVGRVTGETRVAANTPSPAPGVIAFAFDAAAQALGQSYDDLGRTTRDTARSYTWDLASRMTGYSGADGAATFTYDALGQRISRTASGATQNYVWNYATPMPTVATIQQGGADQTYYIWLPNGTLLESIAATGNARRFYHFDEAGSAMILTDDTGAVSDTFAISPYGESITQAGSTVTPFVFQGKFGVMREGATSLFYMRARYYDSTAGRFLSREPMPSDNPKEINPYQFADGNPISLVDPTGMAPAQTDTWNVALEKFAELLATRPEAPADRVGCGPADGACTADSGVPELDGSGTFFTPDPLADPGLYTNAAGFDSSLGLEGVELFPGLDHVEPLPGMEQLPSEMFDDLFAPGDGGPFGPGLFGPGIDTLPAPLFPDPFSPAGASHPLQTSSQPVATPFPGVPDPLSSGGVGGTYWREAATDWRRGATGN